MFTVIVIKRSPKIPYDEKKIESEIRKEVRK